MNLDRLKIERGAGAPPRARGAARRRPWLMRLIASAALVALAWLFRAPLLSFIDRYRLVEVAVARVARLGPAAAESASGAAANGYIIARTRAALSADTPGRIVELNVVEGQAVPKGFVVARLYSEEYAASLRAAESVLDQRRRERLAAQAEVARLEASVPAAAAALELAAAEVRLAQLNQQRVEKLVASGDETEQRLDETRTELETAQAREASRRAELEVARAALAQGRERVQVAAAAIAEAEAERDRARATLEKTEVRAPFDGVVVLKDAEVGEVVSPNVQAGSNARGSVVTMVDFRSLEAQAEVPETSLAAVRIGAPAWIFLDAYPDRPYSGRVDRIWPTANKQKATIEVRAIFDAPDERLRPEMGVRVVFLDDEAVDPGAAAAEAEDIGGLAVPADCIVRRDGGDEVFVLEHGDVARRRQVELAGRRGERAVVRRGLEEDETVVRAPPPGLDDGVRVRRKEIP